MTHENLITVKEGISSEDAQKLLHAHRIEKLIVVDDNLYVPKSEDSERKSGKGRIIHELMQSIGIPTFIDGYHIGWIWEEAEEE